MPSTSKKAQKERSAKTKQDGGAGRYLLPAVIVIAVLVIAAALGIAAYTYGGGQGSFQSFQSAFYSAPRVGIYVTYTNGTAFSYSSGCAYSIIQRIIASRTHHRNASTIDFLIIANSTSCLGPDGALGSSNGTKITPLPECLAVSAHEPSIFINYNMTNSTSIRSGNLYTSGDALFLSECGVASELG